MADPSPYTPVGCGFYDMLEAAAVTRAGTEVRYLAADGTEALYSGRVVDVFSRGVEEFVLLEGDLLIRLDRLVSVNGVMNKVCRAGHP